MSRGGEEEEHLDQEEMLSSEGSEALVQTAQRSCGAPSPEALKAGLDEALDSLSW